MAVSGSLDNSMQVISGVIVKAMKSVSGTVKGYGSGGASKDWQEAWETDVLGIVYEDLGLTVVDGKLCAVYGGDDE